MLTDDEICDLQDVAYSRETPTGPIVPKKSPLTEFIKIRYIITRRKNQLDCDNLLRIAS